MPFSLVHEGRPQEDHPDEQEAREVWNPDRPDAEEVSPSDLVEVQGEDDDENDAEGTRQHPVQRVESAGEPSGHRNTQLGTKVTSGGTYVMRPRTQSRAARYGKLARTSSPNEMSASFASRNRSAPTGGVSKPII